MTDRQLDNELNNIPEEFLDVDALLEDECSPTIDASTKNAALQVILNNGGIQK